MSENTLKLLNSLNDKELTPLQILEYEQKQLQECLFTVKKTYVNTKYWIQNLVDDLLKQIPRSILQNQIKDIKDFRVNEIISNPQKLIELLEDMKHKERNLINPYLSPSRQPPIKLTKQSSKSKKTNFRKLALDSKSQKKIKVVGHWRKC